MSPRENRTDETEFFFKLTPERVLEAVEAGGFAPTGHWQILNSLENRVYDLRIFGDSESEASDAPGGPDPDQGGPHIEDAGERHVIVKFYRPGRWSADQILEEHSFLNELHAAEIPVCYPMEFPGGGTLRETEGIFFAIWPRTGGRPCDELGEEQAAILGRLVARIHNVGEAYPARHRLTLTPDLYAHQPLDYLERHEFLPVHLAKRYRAAVETTVEYYNMLIKDVPLIRIHGDCHAGNLLNAGQGWFFLDFDDFLTGPAVQDLWMLLPARDPHSLRLREIFLEEYRRFRDFPEHWLRLIEPLRALRFIHYAAWVARRWEDPAFPAALPHFGTIDYWENETRDLEEQVERFGDENPELSTSSGPAADGGAAEELTNKDFFWDWDDSEKPD
ncbi:MAG: serine/threonine protein kinase [bacterium]|nr:serine/threonine protein kinase [bacterium]